MKRGVSMLITATEFKSNLGHYLDLAESEDILISRNGKPIAKLSNPYASRSDAMKSLFGIFPQDVSIDEARAIKAENKWKLS